MKKFLAIVFFIVAVSCTKEPATQNDNVENEELVCVNFSATYEGIDFDQEYPLTKTGGSNALYGIQVNEYVTGHENDIYNTEHYCYGYYDDISKLQISFKKNHKYFIRIDYFPNGKKDIYKFGHDWGSPFSVTPYLPDSSPIPFNKIQYSTQFDLGYIGMPCVATKNYHECYGFYQAIDRYMYFNGEFVPTDDSSLSVHFLRMNAGLTIKLEKVDGYNYDQVQIYESDFSPIYTANVKAGETEIVIDKIVLGLEYWDGIPDLYYVDYKIGTPQNPSLFYRGNIELKRNTMRTYTIRLANDLTSTNMNVSYEDQPYAEENGGNLN